MKKINLKNKNLTMKIIAVFFAFILWTYVMSEENPILEKEIPNVEVNILNKDSLKQNDLVLMEPESATITAEIEGRRNDIFKLTQEDIVAQVDLKGYREGVNKVPVKIFNPVNGDIVDYYPKDIAFTIDRIIEKQKPINVKLIGNPKKGYIEDTPKVSPETVLVKGPKSIVNSVERVLATVNIEDTNKNISTSVPMKLIDDENKEITSLSKEPSTVKVEVPILKLKEVKVDPEIIGSPLVDHKVTDISVKPEKVMIKGSEEMVDSMSILKTKPVDISYTTEDLVKKTEFKLPEGVEIVNDIKPEVTVGVNKILTKTFEYNTEDIQLRNISEEYKFEFEESDEKVSIIISGIDDVIEEVEKEDINPYIDLSNLDNGKDTVDLEVDIPKDTTLKSISPKYKTITIWKDDKSDE
mgnify:CR=1 FL=1